MTAKKEVPCTAATGKGTKIIHNMEKDSMKFENGQALWKRASCVDYLEVRAAYVNDWQYSVSGKNGVDDFFKILTIAYEAGRENGIRWERARRKGKR